MNLGSGERVEEKDLRSFVEDKKPTVGRAAEATAVRSFGELEEMEFVEGKAEEGAAGVVRLGLRKHEPGELRGEMLRRFGHRGLPVVANGSEADIVAVDFKLFGNEVEELRPEFRPFRHA